MPYCIGQPGFKFRSEHIPPIEVEAPEKLKLFTLIKGTEKHASEDQRVFGGSHLA